MFSFIRKLFVRKPRWFYGERFLYAMAILLIAHAIGDYALQSAAMMSFKQRPPICFAHALTWTGVMMVGVVLVIWLGLVFDENRSAPRREVLFRVLAIVFLFLLSTHFAIDMCKATGQFHLLFGHPITDAEFATRGALWFDQSLHFVTIVMSYFIVKVGGRLK